MGKFKELLPAEFRTVFAAIVDEGKMVERTSLQASLDATDSATQTRSSAIDVRRSSWLQASGLPHEFQKRIQDLPFEGSRLFLEKTDSKLHSLKGSQATLKSLGLHAPAPQRNHFKPQILPCFYPPQPRQDCSRKQGRNPMRRPPQPPSSQGPGCMRQFSGPKHTF